MKKLMVKTLVFLGYFLAIFLLKEIKLVNWTFTFLTSFFFRGLQWFFGALIGAHFLKLDQLVYVYLTAPNEQLSLAVKQLIKQKKIAAAWDLLEERINDQPRLATRSFLFQSAWVVLALFALTSTASFFGRALVMAVGLKLLIEEWENYLLKGNINFVFWQIKREVTLKEQKWFLWLITGLFGVLSLLLI